MGYYMNQEETNFFIPKEYHGLMLQKIKSLMVDTDAMRGGSWGGGGVVEKWYSWVHTQTVLEAVTVQDALKAWRWEPDLNEEGDIVYLSFIGEKSGQDDVILNAIAPYVKEGSYISMRGEDGALWQWFFDGKELKEKYGRVVYE